MIETRTALQVKNYAKQYFRQKVPCAAALYALHAHAIPTHCTRETRTLLGMKNMLVRNLIHQLELLQTVFFFSELFVGTNSYNTAKRLVCS